MCYVKIAVVSQLMKCRYHRSKAIVTLNVRQVTGQTPKGNTMHLSYIKVIAVQDSVFVFKMKAAKVTGGVGGLDPTAP